MKPSIIMLHEAGIVKHVFFNPVKQDRDTAGGYSNREESGMPPVRMLIIDDEPSFSSALARHLSHDGVTVDTAANGELALRQLHTHRYNAVLCDLLMPELSGPDFY